MMADMVHKATAFQQMDAINDQLHSVVRLLNRPEACPPQALDVVVIALHKIHSDYQSLAHAMRRESQESRVVGANAAHTPEGA